MDGSAERDDARRHWPAATSELTTGHDPTVHQRRRRRLALAVSLSVLVWVVALGVGVLLARHDHPGQDHHASPPAWRLILGLTLTIAGLTLEVVGLRRWRRSGEWSSFWRTPMLALPRQQRRQLLRQVRGAAPVDPAQLPLLRELARRLQKQYRWGPYQLVVLGGVVLATSSALNSTGPWRWLGLAWPLLYPVAVLAARRDARRADAFLTRHPGGVGDP